MFAMILAAGRGERMRPLTDTLPKPLLAVNDKPLIEYHIEKISQLPIADIVINQAWLGHLLPQQLGFGERWNVKIHYSNEGDNALETAGGIKKALSLIDEDYLLVVNGDVSTDFDFSTLPTQLPRGVLAHLILVENPAHNPNGDFALSSSGLLSNGIEQFTFSGIAVYHRQFFDNIEEGVSALGPLIRQQMVEGTVTGEVYTGKWFDIGTPQRLELLDAQLRAGLENGELR
ncbi:N-acetylmuramate alpha-1-phosphate uridylyltransferase MurU [Psychrobium sp. nBUS_13]|uniref:N-acetylmuramate alpha-1-phosphate uridylyltransferase MurU n=1 Tax=Psychrobium sp. nBUS_13 TaxID=3395319 RepID=UPI003EBE9419